MTREKGRTGYFLKLPKGARRSFAVIRYEDSGGLRKQSTLEDERVDAINRAFKEGMVSFDKAKAELKHLIDGLRQEAGKPSRAAVRAGLSQDNAALFDRFWEEVYEGRELADRRTAELDYLRALRLLGPTPLLSASKTELAKALRARAKSVHQHRRAVTQLNSLLKFSGRGIRLDKPQEEVQEIKHLTIDDLHTLLAFEEDKACRALYATLFATGMRIGEAMPLTSSMRLQGTLYIGKQITKEGRLKKPKRGKTGEIVYLKEFESLMKEWLEVEEKPRYRRIADQRLRAAVRKLWPKDPMKHITIHGLRHSHAIHLLSLGVPMDFVARNLRNRIEVCQKHYAGFSHSQSTISAFQAFLSRTISS